MYVCCLGMCIICNTDNYNTIGSVTQYPTYDNNGMIDRDLNKIGAVGSQTSNAPLDQGITQLEINKTIPEKHTSEPIFTSGDQNDLEIIENEIYGNT